MYNNGSIYQDVLIITRKDSSGDTITPENMTELLKVCCHEKANDNYNLYETSQIISDSLRALEASASISLTAGVGSLPADYFHIKINGVLLGGYPADVVTDYEWMKSRYSQALLPKSWCPIARIVGSNVQVFPTTESSCTVEYLKKFTDPYFDYYHDADDNIVYLPEGVSYTLKTGETYTDKDDGTERTAGYTISSGENKSKELFFPENERVDVMYRILQKLGVALNDDIKTQYSLQKEQQIKSGIPEV